jgi:protein TonB
VGEHFLLWAGLLSVAVHAALLLGFVRPHAASGLPTAANTLQARLVMQPAAMGTSMAAMPLMSRKEASPVASTAPPTVTTLQRDPNAALLAAGPAAQPVAESAAQPGLAPAPAYHGAKGLDPPPRPLQAIDPLYPESAGLREGSVVLRLLISSSGDVDEVAVVRANPAGFFEQSALDAFGRAKFSPGYYLGIPVKSQIFIEVGYTPINRGGAVSGQLH